MNQSLLPGGQVSVDRAQAREILVLSQRLPSRTIANRKQGPTPRFQIFSELISWKTGTRGESLGIVHVVVSCHAVTTRIDQVLLDELTEARSLVQLAHEEQATVGTDR